MRAFGCWVTAAGPPRHCECLRTVLRLASGIVLRPDAVVVIDNRSRRGTGLAGFAGLTWLARLAGLAGLTLAAACAARTALATRTARATRTALTAAATGTALTATARLRQSDSGTSCGCAQNQPARNESCAENSNGAA